MEILDLFQFQSILWLAHLLLDQLEETVVGLVHDFTDYTKFIKYDSYTLLFLHLNDSL